MSSSSENEAVRWPSSGVVSLGIKRSEVFAVSGDGRYAVGGWLETVTLGPPQRTAFRWSAGGVDDLPPSADGDVDCLAVAVSGDGAIVAGNCTETAGAAQHWYLWTEAIGTCQSSRCFSSSTWTRAVTVASRSRKERGT